MRLFYLFSLLLLTTSLGHAQKITEHTIHSDVLDMDRELLVYTPWQLEEFDDAKVDVIYVFDAQARSFFDLVHATVDLYGPGPMPFLVVGVKSPYIADRQWNRNTEMLPAPDNPEWIERYNGYAGKADSLLLFLERELLPWVDDNYPTLPRRVAVGHSNGANYVSRGSEGPATGFNGWDTAAAAGWERLDSLSQTGKMGIVMEAFPEQSHMKSFVRALPSALEHFFAGAFQDGDNAVAYLKQLETEGHRSLNPNLVNGMAYFANKDGNTEGALTILNFAVARFPDDSNLRDSQGEMLQSLGRIKEARLAYEAAISVLAAGRSGMEEEEYLRTKAYYEKHLLDLKK